MHKGLVVTLKTVRVPPSLDFEFGSRNSDMRPSSLDSSSLKTPGLMVGIIDSSTNVKLEQFAFFGVRIFDGRISAGKG